MSGSEHELIKTLRDAQRFGFFGSGDVVAAAAHAEGFVRAIEDHFPLTRLVDIGSGGGLPGLVLAAALPQVAVTLVDRREKRTDFLHRAARRLGFDHVVVRTLDVLMLAERVEAGDEPAFDVVTARGFGPPEATLRVARALTHQTGMVVISEPPTGDRWPKHLLDELGLTARRVGAVRVFTPTPELAGQ